MNRIIILIAISLIIITAITGIIKPKIYKPVRFSAANMGLENLNQEIVNTKSPIIEDSPVEITEAVIKPEIPQNKIKDQKIKIKPQKSEFKEKQIKPETKKTKTEQTTIKQVHLPKSVQDIVNSQQTPPQQTQKPAEIIKEKAPEVTLPKQEELKTILTEEEEIILWNKWRSDLQNQVMRDARIAAPMGTRFRFSFTVDKFGNISNLRVWSDTSYYTPLAVDTIKPVLLSYQGKNILKFPKGTKRIQTNVTGGFVISTYDKYSRPDDYADVEKIRRLRNVQM